MRFQQVRRPGKRLVCVSLFFFSLFFLPLSFPLMSKTIPGLGGNAQEFLDTLVDEAKKLEGGLSLSVPAFCLSFCLPICPSVHLSIYVTSCVHRLRLFCLCMVHCLRSLLTRAPSRHFERRFSLSRIMCLGHHSLYLVMTYLAPLG